MGNVVALNARSESERSGTELLHDSCLLTDVVLSDKLWIAIKLSMHINLGPCRAVWECSGSNKLFSSSILCRDDNLCSKLSPITNHGIHSLIPINYSSSHHVRCHTVITLVTSVTSDRLLTDPRVTVNFAKRFTAVTPPSACQDFKLVDLANNCDGYSD